MIEHIQYGKQKTKHDRGGFGPHGQKRGWEWVGSGWERESSRFIRTMSSNELLELSVILVLRSAKKAKKCCCFILKYIYINNIHEKNTKYNFKVKLHNYSTNVELNYNYVLLY